MLRLACGIIFVKEAASSGRQAKHLSLLLCIWLGSLWVGMLAYQQGRMQSVVVLLVKSTVVVSLVLVRDLDGHCGTGLVAEA